MEHTWSTIRLAREHLNNSVGVAGALARVLVHAQRYPVLVNEALAALALLASSPTGAENVLSALLSSAVPASSSQSIGTREEHRGLPGFLPGWTETSSGSSGPYSEQADAKPALQMLLSVLARRDARMPPLYVINACWLVYLMLSTAALSSLPFRYELASKTIPWLQHLALHGPNESTSLAFRAAQQAQLVLERHA